MAIHAQKTTFRPGVQSPDFLITSQLVAGQILIYDANLGAFVNKPPACIAPAIAAALGGGGGGGGTITGATNVGGGIGIYAGLDTTTIEMRTLAGNQGITVGYNSGNNDQILISNDIITQSQISVPGGFKIVIDNDNTTANSALFQIMTLKSSYLHDFEPIQHNTGNFGVNVITDINNINHGQFELQTGNWEDYGFEAGMPFKVSGSGEQDGEYIIESVVGDLLTITTVFSNQTDGGLQPPMTFYGSRLYFGSNFIRFFGYDWTASGLSNGQQIVINNSSDNDGTKTISSITSTNLVFTTNFTGTLGFDEEIISVGTVPQILPTGWFTDEEGFMQSNGAEINGDLTVSGNGNAYFNNNVSIDGDLTINGTLLDDYINDVFPLDSLSPGIIAKVNSTTYANRTISAGAGIDVANGNGVSGDPTISVEDFVLSYTGDLSGSNTVTGLNDTTFNLVLNTLHAGGSWNKVTVDSKGRVVGGTNPTITGNNGIVVINGDGVAGDPVIQANDFTLTYTGDVTGSGLVDGLTNTSILLTLPNVVTSGTYNQVTVDAKGRVITGSLNAMNYQPIDEDLTDLAGGMPSPGYIVWQGNDYIDREILGTTNEITVTDGTGTSGDTILRIADDTIMPGFGAIVLPKGVTTQRSLRNVDGALRYNTETLKFEGRINGTWENISTASVSGVYLPLSGGTMTGSITMGANNIITTGLVDGRDVSADGSILDEINQGTGYKVRVGSNDFENRSIVSVANTGIIITNGNGVAGNTTIGLDVTSLPALGVGEVIDQDTDLVVVYDVDQAHHVKATVSQLVNNREAFRYFMAQF